MTLTIKEKEHWKDRIEKKIERRIDLLIKNKQRDYLKTVAELARSKAIEAAGLVKNQRRQVEIEKFIKQLNNEQDILKHEFGVAITGLTLAAITDMRTWEFDRLVEAEFGAMTDAQERLVMEGDELGREILKLRDEQEQLLDTVWLATSNSQIRQLWQNVSELLTDTPTDLQKAAITVESTDD